jgi:hypothetical protein
MGMKQSLILRKENKLEAFKNDAIRKGLGP